VEGKTEETGKGGFGDRLKKTAITMMATNPLALCSGVGAGAVWYYNKYKKDKIEWKKPHEAYMALADAIYRPRVTLDVKPSEDRKYRKENNSTFTYVTHKKEHDIFYFKVFLPFFIPDQSTQYIIIDNNSVEPTGRYNSSPVKITKSTGPCEYKIVKPVKTGREKFIAMVRLDLYGDGSVELPHEPLFCDNKIVTKIDKRKLKGVQLSTEHKWIKVEATGDVTIT
jgi:hypothetical protein